MVEILVGGKLEQKVTVTVAKALNIPEHFLSLVNVQNVENSTHTIFGSVHFPMMGQIIKAN